MDDVFYFGPDGSFANVQGGSTWLEGWQNGGAAEACGTPVAPHDGSADATYAYDAEAGTLTVAGIGAHLGLPKVVNAGEISNGVPVPESVIYTVDTLTADGSAMTVFVEAGAGVFWTFDLIKVADAAIVGSWKLGGEGSFRVGPTALDGGWFSADSAVVAERACLMDDVFYFGADGSFANVQGGSTWLEGWQNGGAAEACGTPVAPHDGSTPASYIYDAEAGTLTLNGSGAHVGLPKAMNAGELPNVAVPDAVTYQVEALPSDGSAMTIYVESGAGVFWTFDLVK
jgi:hypothetical protein